MATSPNRPKKTISRARALVCLAVLLLVVLGFSLIPGFGSLCAAGVGAVFALCPLGILEALAAEKLMVPQLAISLVCMALVVALLGRSFCSWVCPAPRITRFFHPEKKAQQHSAGVDGEQAGANANGDGGGGSVAGTSGSGNSGGVAGTSENASTSENGDGGADASTSGSASASRVASASASTSGNANGGVSASASTGGPVGCMAVGSNSKASQARDLKPLSDEEKRLLSASCHESFASLAPVGGKRDGVQIDSRHFVLVGALASSAVFGLPVFCLVCPVGLSVATLAALWIALVDHNPTWMLAVFPAVLLVELVVFRKWCHTLCPLGALMSLVGVKAPVGKPRVDAAKCLRSQGVDCRACTRICPEQLDPHGDFLSECTRCGLCVENCPGHAISLAFWHARTLDGFGGEGTKAQNREVFGESPQGEEVEYD